MLPLSRPEKKIIAGISEENLKDEIERAKKWYDSLDTIDQHIVNSAAEKLYRARKSRYVNNNTIEVLARAMYSYGGSREFSIIEALINI